jgi:hypothetical protein
VNRGQRVATGRSGGRLAALVCLVAVEASGEVCRRRVDLVGLVCHDNHRLFLEALLVFGCVVLFLLGGSLWRGAIVGCAHVAVLMAVIVAPRRWVRGSGCGCGVKCGMKVGSWRWDE